ncbi:biopolymer transporter ExbD [Allomuricauda sp. NBRC 101325]|uniref:ExbD/TolR family protein n=1 Tax=Allomuricauda sp. NBRC 101325 TaxID=1113758 RepID=UPI0024A1C9A9|nr:biopolymer transporter ExbD [Muricauda sp. NBRC 101325]GLU42778.1 biopolymer transporter ExbD [Muricauda sp. NBRC 101325]
MGRTRENPEVHAGSMADIAFLLLIFFLVTTTIETDMGLDRKLPPDIDTPVIDLYERNVLRIILNKNDELLVEDEVVPITKLKQVAINFLDNGGGLKEGAVSCTYCMGDRNPESSDNPQKAIISLNSDRNATYGTYVEVQDQISAAYNALRERESQRLFNKSFSSMEDLYYAPETSEASKAVLKDQIEEIRSMFPMKLSEAEIQHSNQL